MILCFNSVISSRTDSDSDKLLMISMPIAGCLIEIFVKESEKKSPLENVSENLFV